MLHTVYIYNDDKELIQRGTIWCEDYYISSRRDYMALVVLSGTMRYYIYGRYIIVI